MANISFLDLMFAEALASGLAREAAMAEKPPPDNFFLLPPGLDAWKKIELASRKENMVVCFEFTDDSCKPAQRIFMDLAREFESIPFVRVEIGLGRTYDTMRSDLGGVKYTPTILIVFYGDGSVARAKFEGNAEIREIGRIKGVIKELVDRRVKLKVAEGLAEGLAHHVKSQISEKERKMREEYEDKLKREMSEKEEEFKKKDEEKKRKEEQEELDKDKKLRLAREKLQELRPEHLKELQQMNLDKAPIRELKGIMEKMGISPRGCISRKDLKEKLLENVPELRLQQSGQLSGAPERQNIDSFGGSQTSDKVESLQKELARESARARKAEDSLGPLQSQIAALQNQVVSLRTENSRLRSIAARGPPPAAERAGSGNRRMRELEERLLETRMLYTTNLEHFEIIKVISEDTDSLVLRAKCVRPGVPNPDRTYAIKFLSDYLHETTQTQVSKKFRNEYDVLCQLPPHENIIHMWAFFYDRPGPEVKKYFRKLSGNFRSLGLFILMDEHPLSMMEQLAILADNRGPLSNKVVEWMRDVMRGLVFLEKHHVVHRDLKLSNLLLTKNGKVIICDFGKAIYLGDSYKVSYPYAGMDIGGNQAHLAPEILNCRSGPRSTLDYSKQPVWAAGVLAYELAGHQSPFASGTIDQRGYAVDQLPALRTTYCSNSAHYQKLPAELTRLAGSMLQPDPSDRPSLQRCLDTLNNI